MEFKHEFETETGQGIGYREGKVDPEDNGNYNDAYVEWLETELKKFRLGDVIKSLNPELQKALNDFSKTQETKEPTKKRF